MATDYKKPISYSWFSNGMLFSIQEFFIHYKITENKHTETVYWIENQRVT